MSAGVRTHTLSRLAGRTGGELQRTVRPVRYYRTAGLSTSQPNGTPTRPSSGVSRSALLGPRHPTALGHGVDVDYILDAAPFAQCHATAMQATARCRPLMRFKVPFFGGAAIRRTVRHIEGTVGRYVIWCSSHSDPNCRRTSVRNAGRSTSSSAVEPGVQAVAHEAPREIRGQHAERPRKGFDPQDVTLAGKTRLQRAMAVTTPFGRPVVPDVNSISASSSSRGIPRDAARHQAFFKSRCRH